MISITAVYKITEPIQAIEHFVYIASSKHKEGWENSRQLTFEGLHCLFYFEGIRPERYELPFYDMVTANPSYDEMKKVVTEQEKRPLVHNRWTENSVSDLSQP